MKTRTTLLTLAIFAMVGCEKDGATPGSDTGIGGSMARFTISKNHLYTVDNSHLKAWSLSDPQRPSLVSNTDLGFGVETIFPYNDQLFIGAMSGMQIFDISQPANPVHLSTFEHVESCDPVVANEDWAFVTLRTASECQRGVDQLDVLDITDLRNPELVQSYGMTNPHGLGIDGTLLFVCDGVDGLKIYDANDPTDLQMISHYDEIESHDVIPYENILMLIGPDGLFQFDYSDPTNIRMYGEIPIAT